MSYWGPVTTAGRISQAFGANPGGLNPAGGHTGRDWALGVGTPLAARGDGTVLHAGPLTGQWSDNPWLLIPSWAGFFVVIDYGPWLSIYSHCSGSPVRAGDRVRRGQIVASSGDTGMSTGPHLHEEAMPDGWNVMNGTYGRVDPAIYDTSLSTQGEISMALSLVELHPVQAEAIAARAAELVGKGVTVPGTVELTPVQAEAIAARAAELVALRMARL